MSRRQVRGREMGESCPTAERLASMLRRKRPADEDAGLVEHLAVCPACRARIEELAGGLGWVEAGARAHVEPPAAAADALEIAMRALVTLRRTPDPSTATLPLDFLVPSDDPNVLGCFGPYEVLRLVACGGMGIVLKARDPSLHRVVALKILPPALAANALARARFIREARAAAAVVHENVVPIHAVDEFDHLPYIVMQFVEGRSLAERIQFTGALQLEEILRIGAQTAIGLAAAHAQGLIHRDVKPGNIRLENTVGRVKLTDFGLARAVDDAGLTRAGELAGTPEFMAPEQASNEPIDHRADLFSLGSVLYAMCTGCSPFQGATALAVLRKVCDSEPRPPHELNPSIPSWLSEIVAQLMAKDPAARFSSASDVANLLSDRLARLQTELPVAAIAGQASSGAKFPHARLAYVVGTVALLAAAALAGLFRRNRAPGPPVPPAASGSAAPERPALEFRTTPTPAVDGDDSQPDRVFHALDDSGNALGSYATAEEAILGAPQTFVLELRWDGPRLMPPIDLGHKALMLRPAAGFRPVWRHQAAGSPAIQTQADLDIEDLEIQFASPQRPGPGLGEPPPREDRGARPSPSEPAGPQPAPPGAAALVSVTGAPLRLSRCYLHCEIGPQQVLRQRTLIDLIDSPQCVLRDSAFNAIVGRCVAWHRTSPDPEAASNSVPAIPASLVLSNSALFGLSVVWLDSADASQAEFEFDRCTFRGRALLDLAPTPAVGRVSVRASRNIFSTGSLIYDDREAPVVHFTKWLAWEGRENLFGLVRGFFTTADAGVNLDNNLAAWARHWDSEFTRSCRAILTFRGGQRGRGASRDRDPGYTMFELQDVEVLEGPPLPTEQWTSVGAQIGSIGPRARR